MKKVFSGEYGTERIAVLDDDDLDFYKSNKSFQKHLKANRVGLEGYELWVNSNDYYMKKLYKN